MSAIRLRNFSHIADYDEPPTKRLVSEGDILIKQLSEKQRKTSVNLQEELANAKEFTSGSELTPLSSYDPGTKTLQDFKETVAHFSYTEKLRAAGLTNEDVQMLLDSSRGEDYLLRKHKNWEHSLLQQRLNSIKDIVRKFEENEGSLDDGINKQQRHDVVEYGLSAKPDSIETKLLRFALQNQKQKQKSELPHPINTIKQIEENRFSYLNETASPSVSKIRRKARKLMNRVKNASLDLPFVPNITNTKCAPAHSLAKDSKWDMTQTNETSRLEEDVKKTYTCLPQNYYTIRDGAIVKLNKDEIQQKNLEVAARLSIEEIRKLPKFHDYDVGSPSKVLYLRNLSNGLKENDLKELFRNCSDSNVTYRIMTGRMRGQAFVTFPDEAMAKKALDNVNGIVVGTKPVIIQFGHKVDTET